MLAEVLRTLESDFCCVALRWCWTVRYWRMLNRLASYTGTSLPALELLCAFAPGSAPPRRSLCDEFSPLAPLLLEANGLYDRFMLLNRAFISLTDSSVCLISSSSVSRNSFSFKVSLCVNACSVVGFIDSATIVVVGAIDGLL